MAAELRIKVETDFKRLVAEFKAEGRTLQLAASRALNRAATTVRAQASREIRKRYAIPSARLKGQIRIRKANPNRLRSEVIAGGSRVALSSFAARQAKRSGNVTVRVLRAGGRKVVHGTRKWTGRPFIVTLDSGHAGVFQRGTEKRFKIHQLFSIDLPTAFTSRKVFAVIARIGADRFATVFAQELRFRTRGR